MHIMVVCEIRGTGVSKRKTVQRIKDALGGHSWVRVLAETYIVKIRSQQDRLLIVEQLKEIARNYPKSLRFVATPLMIGGNYAGWLPKDTWPKINKRTRQDA